MKTRNRIRSIPFLFLMLAGLSAFFNCKGNPFNPTPPLYTVSFDAQGGAPTPPLQQIGQGKTVSQPTDPARDSFTFGGWYKESECTTPWNFATDTVTANITLYAKWKPTPITIQFNSSKMSCWKEVNDTGIPISDGAIVYENDELFFIAQPSAGKMADSWMINDTPVPPQEAANERWYTVNAQPSSLNVSYTEKLAEKVELRFDTSKIRCTKLFDQTPILPGPRDEGDLLVFTAKNGTAVLWKINGRLIPRPLKNCYVPFIKEILEEEFGNGHDVTVSYE